MHAAKLLAFLATGVIAAVVASPTITDPGNTNGIIPTDEMMVDLEWEVQATPGAPSIRINGTVEDVIAKLEETNPDIRASVLKTAAKAKKDTSKTAYEMTSHYCFGPWATASLQRIKEGIDYLRGVPGKPVLGPGPGTCKRVSCSYNSAIYWCNDNMATKSLDTYGSIADGAEWISNNCVRRTMVSVLKLTAGQVFYEDNWNVIVRGDTC